MGTHTTFGHRSPVRFGPYEVDFNSGELRKHGTRIRLQDQPMHILRLLLDRPGQFVAREDLIRQLWPEGTFVDYDHSLNASVAKLRQALLDSADRPRYIETLGRRGYRFIANTEVLAAPGLPPHQRRPRNWISVLAFLVLAMAVGFIYFRWARKAIIPASVAPLTSYPGLQITPAFSPDGKQVAFSWDGERGGNFDIYVKMLDAGAPLRLTNNSAAEYFPAWSPDGRYIAFSRMAADRFEIWTVPALGGAERKLGQSTPGGGLSWSPDGKFLALVDELPRRAYSLALLKVDTNEKRQLTSPPDKSFGDFDPEFSPDGKAIAFLRASSAVTADVYVLRLNDGGIPVGEPRRLTSNERVFGLDWTADSRRIVYSSNHPGSAGLWTILASGGRPERVTVGGEKAFGLSVSRSGNRLVYERRFFDGNIWRLPGPNSSNKNSAPDKLIASTEHDGEAQFSRDGKKIVFSSGRSGNIELWVCDGEGHGCVQLTFLGGPMPGSPRWSPDGRWVAFDSPKAGNSDIYVVSSEGGLPRQLTTESSADVRPSWSRDGRWIYFGSNRSGDWQIWKSPAQGGRALQVTRNKGAKEAFESLDGKFVYYAKADSPGIWRIPVEGGEETRLFEGGHASLWSVGQQGVSFLDLSNAAWPTVKFYSFGTRKVTFLRRLPKDTKFPTTDSSISVSADGKWILYTQLDQAGGDLMLVENFR